MILTLQKIALVLMLRLGNGISKEAPASNGICYEICGFFFINLRFTLFLFDLNLIFQYSLNEEEIEYAKVY